MISFFTISFLSISYISVGASSRRMLKSNDVSLKFKDLLGFNVSRPRMIQPDRDLSAGDQYGHAISIWQSYAIISATGENSAESSGLDNGGMVFQFVQRNGIWKQQSTVLTSGTLGDAYGESLSMCEGFAIVGAWKDSSFGTFSGKAYVYKFSLASSGQSMLLENQVLTMDNAAAGDFFGFSVAIVPQFDAYMKGAAIVGAFGYNKNNNIVDSGVVVVFARVSDAWIQVAVLQGSDSASFDSFGWSVAAHDKAIVVGAPEAGSDSGQGGAAYVYIFDSEVIQSRRALQGQDPEHREQDDRQQPSNFLAWQYIEAAKLTSVSSGSANSMFGVDLAVHNDSNVLTVAVGACLDNARGYHAGAVYVFSRAKNADLVGKFVSYDNKNQKQQQQGQGQGQGGNQKNRRVMTATATATATVHENSSTSESSSGAFHRTASDRRLQDGQPQDADAQQQQQQRDQQQRDQQQRDQQQQGGGGRWEIVVTSDMFADKTGRYWVREASLFGSSDLMRFGRSLALGAGALVVGADMSGLAAGRAFVFARKQSSSLISSSSIKSGPLRNCTWVRAAVLKNVYGTVGDFFGASCDIYGGRAIVGAYMNSASDAKLRSNTRSDSSQMMFPGAAYAFFADDSVWMANANGSMSLFSSSTFMASVALTLALLVVIVSGMLVYRALLSQKDRGYLHTNTMDVSGSTRTDSAMDVSLRSSDALQPSRGGSSGLHLSSFRKKRNKVSSLSVPLGGPSPPSAFASSGGSMDAGGDSFHSGGGPGLLEEHGMGQPSTAQSRFGTSSGSYANTGYNPTAVPNYFAAGPGENAMAARINMPHGVSTRQGSSLSGAGTGAAVFDQSGRRSSLTRKASGGMELAPPSDF